MAFESTHRVFLHDLQQLPRKSIRELIYNKHIAITVSVKNSIRYKSPKRTGMSTSHTLYQREVPR